MAAPVHTTPSGVNASGLSGFSLVHGALPVPISLLTAETVALLDVIERQDRDTRRLWPRPCPRSPCTALFFGSDPHPLLIGG